MPQVDHKVTCETTIISSDDPAQPDPEPTLPDYAPESFWLSKDAELDWLDENAFFDRKDSSKGGSSVISSSHPNPNPNPNSASVSQRYSGNLKPKAAKHSIIGLPKPQKPTYVVGRPASIRLFPNRTGPVGGRAPAVSEPSSPKVSCMGRVRSRKDRSRRGKNRKKAAEPGLVRVRSVKERKAGFWRSFRLMFRSKAHKTGCKVDETVVEPVTRTGSRSERKRGLVLNEAGSVEPPGLGGVKRFASGRRSDAWAGDLEVDGARSEPLDKGSIWHRRDKGPPKEVIVERNWHSVGPASV